MTEELARLLLPWAGIWTWHTMHPLDQQRFYDSVESIFDELGADVDRDEFRDALVSVVSKTPDTLDGSQSDEIIDRFVDKAMGILGYLEYHRRNRG